jgi:Uma2 family endonuclease
MAASSRPPYLTLEEFDQLYGDEKPYYEYWDGQAIQKPTPTLLHSLLQLVLINLLREAGLISGGEVRLKLSQTKQPLPDVIAGSRLQHPYPTKPFAVAVEILSPEDRMQRVLRRCRFLSEQGIPYVYVFDPEDRTAQCWNHGTGTLENIEFLESGGWPSIPVERIWLALDRELEKVDFSDTNP